MSKVTITVTGRVGSGKSALCGEIEILCKALGLEVEWQDGQAEKNLTHADWTESLEMYKPSVEIVEKIEPTAKVGGDEREAFERFARSQTFIKDCQRFDAAEKGSLNEYGHWESQKARHVWLAALDYARAALSADGGEDKRDAESIAKRMIQEDDFASLFSFVTTCQDSEADGYTIDDDSMKRLAELGFVRRVPGFGKRYETTAIGDWLVEAQFHQNPRLPLRTVTEHNVREQAGHALYLKEAAPHSTAWVELGNDERESWRRKAANQASQGGEQ